MPLFALDNCKLCREGDQPQGARARVRERRGKMRIDIPPASIVSGNKLGAAGFAVSWNVGIGVWTASAIAAGSIAASLFSIPFWAAGSCQARRKSRTTRRFPDHQEALCLISTYTSGQGVPKISLLLHQMDISLCLCARNKDDWIRNVLMTFVGADAGLAALTPNRLERMALCISICKVSRIVQL